jgi:hypothetical protein
MRSAKIETLTAEEAINMRYYAPLDRVKHTDTTAAMSVANYGLLVKFHCEVDDRVKNSPRKDWSPDRLQLARLEKLIPVMHQAIADRWGQDTVTLAVNTHPFP